MRRTIEAVIDSDGRVELLEDVDIQEPHRALVTILDSESANSEALSSELALSIDWNRPEEDEAWDHLQSAQ